MSRDLTGTNIETALTTAKTYKMSVKAIVDPSRTYFSTLTDDDPYDGEDYSEITDRQFQVTRSGSSSGMEIETLGTYTGDGGFIDFNPKKSHPSRYRKNLDTFLIAESDGTITQRRYD